jgi:hypothetical protein
MARRRRPSKLTISLPNRLPLPGQCQDYEARLREELIEQFKPADAFEEMWIEDIAYCSVAIEHDRAMIAAFRLACLKRIQENLTKPEDAFMAGSMATPVLDPRQEALLGLFEEQNLMPVNGVSYLANPTFAMLLGQLTSREHYQLRQLQMLVHQEMMERDRLINQLKRTRRQAMRDAIECAELASRAAGDHPLALTAEPGSSLADIEDATGAAVDPPMPQDTAMLADRTDNGAIPEPYLVVDPDLPS